MDRTLTLKVAAVQLLVVGAMMGVIGAALPHSFFEDWGWVAGPAAWILASALTARVLRLDLRHALLGAALAGIPSGIATIAGQHALGALLAIIAFALWCGRTEPKLSAAV